MAQPREGRTRALMIARMFPFIVMIVSTYIFPWGKRTYLITGLSGKNFQQTEVGHCENLYVDRLVGCEDLHVYHGAEGPMIFTGCSNTLQDRLDWFPGILARDTSKVGNYTSPFFVYEPAKDVLTELSLKNFPANTDRVWHGFDIYETSPGNILIYAINHRRTGSVIERFHHTIGSGKLVWERTFDTDHDILFQPNDVAVVGKDDFYVTNDHVDTSGLWATAVDYLRLPLTHVVYHDRTKGYRVVAKSVKGANGICAGPDNKIYVDALFGGEVLIYERNETGHLKWQQRIELDFLPDNPSITPNGDLLITGVPNAKTATDHSPDAKPHSKVVRISLAQLGDAFFGTGSGRTTKPIIEDVLMDGTGMIPAATTAVEVSYGGADWLFVSSWRASALTRCKLTQSQGL